LIGAVEFSVIEIRLHDAVVDIVNSELGDFIEKWFCAACGRCVAGMSWTRDSIFKALQLKGFEL